jgi:hypothetical protein
MPKVTGERKAEMGKAGRRNEKPRDAGAKRGLGARVGKSRNGDWVGVIMGLGDKSLCRSLA